MEENILMQISNKIKVARKNKNITIQALANKVNVSKGLISQIENNRTIPSLLVLMNIINSLHLDLNDFFKDIEANVSSSKVIVKRYNEYKNFEKESTRGFTYKRILTSDLHGGPIDIVLLELKKGAQRTKMVRTEAFEYKYMIKGEIEYLIEKKKIVLKEGDSIYFDGRLDHKPKNIGETDAIMLVIYFFIA